MRIQRFTAILTACVLFSCFIPSVFAEHEIKEDVHYNEAQQMLTALGVNHFSDLESVVTYNNFNDALVTALDLGNSFYNITQLTCISYSGETGQKAISFDDAVRSLVNITGYRITVSTEDGNINGYIPVAASKGILKNVDIKIGKDLTARDAAVMIYNALGIEVLQSIYKGSKTEYKTFKDETLLYKYRNMRKDKGIVEANQYVSVDNGKTTGKNNVRISGEYYQDPHNAVGDYVGYAIEFYYTEGRNSDELIINFAWKDVSKNDEIIIDRSNFVDNEGRKIFYEVHSRERNEVIPATALIIYNGKAIYEYDNTLFDFSNKDAVLLDNNSDGNLDVVIIQEGVDCYVSRVDTEHGIIYDGLSKEEIHINEDFERVRIYNDDGQEINSFAISESEVVTVYASADGELMDIYISKKQMTGKVEGRTESDGETYYTVSNEKYYPSQAFEKYMKNEIAVGVTHDFYLNKKNEIVYVKAVAGELSYGYLVESGVESGIEDKVWCRILAADGEFYSYNLKEKAKIDGKSYKKSEKYNELLSTPQLIRYEIDEAKEITVIDTSTRGSGETADSLNSFGAKNQMSYNASLIGFDEKLKIDADKTLIFFCPNGREGEDGYGVSKADYLKSSEKYIVQGFSSSSKNCVAEAVVIDGDINNYKKVDKFSKSYIVKNVVWTLNEDDEVVQKYTVFNRATEYTIFCANEQVGTDEDIHQGDIINAALNGKGQFCDIVKVYDARTHTKLQSDVISAFEGAEFASRCRMAAGYVYFNNNTTIGISAIEPWNNSDFVKDELNYFKVNDNLGVIVDSNYGKEDERYIRRAAMSEIKDYLNYNDCAQVFVRTDQGNPSFIVVYQ